MTTVNPIQIQKFLTGIDYPASKQELIERARQEGADQDVLSSLEGMPGEEYNSPNDVSEALGKMK